MKRDIHYVSCLQGNFMKLLNSNNDNPKNQVQYKNILKHLEKYKQNYFVNSQGLKKLFSLLV